MSLIEEMKKKIEFVEKAPVCRDCQFYKELEDHHLERSWIPTCTKFEIQHFAVNSDSTCRFFERKGS